MSERRKIRWFQFSLRSLFLMTACAALGLTALKFSTHGWSIAVASTTAALLLFALLQAFHARDAVRPFWSGFAICAWGYMAMVLVLGMANNLATGEFLDFLFYKFNPEAKPPRDPFEVADPFAPQPTFQGVDNIPDPIEPKAANNQPSNPPATESNSAPLDPDLDVFGNPPPDMAPDKDKAPDKDDVPLPPLPDKFSPEALAKEKALQDAAKAAQEAAELLQLRHTYFPRIGHCLFALLIGCLGGLVAQGIAANQREVPVS